MRHPAPRSSASSRRRPRLRIVVALTALLLAVALPAQAQTETDDPVLSIQLDDSQAPVTIAWSRLAGHLDADPVAYADGKQRTPRGIYVDSALALGGLPPQTYRGAATLEDPANVFEKEDLIRHAAILFRGEDGTLRLLRTSATGLDGGERVVDAVYGTLTLRLDRRPELIASMPEVVPGGKLTFYASIPPQLDPATVTYQWEFNDGARPQTTTAPSITRAFQARNRQDTRYNVSVTFYVNGKRYDDMLPLITTITVKIPEGDKYKGLESGDGGAHSSGRDGQGVRDGEQSRRRASSTPTGGGSGSGSGGGTGSGGDPTGGSTYTPPPVAQTPVTPVTPPPTPEPRTPRTPRRTPRAQRRTTVTPAPPAGETVDGYLLASADVPLASAGGHSEQSRVAARTLPQPDDHPLELPTPVWVAVGLLALVLLGWGLESRTTLPYFRP